MTIPDNTQIMPVALTMEYRLPMYPVSRVKDGKAETGMGTVSFTNGRLTAYHRDMLDVVIGYSEELRLNGMGEVEVIFDPPRIARVLGIDSEWRFQRRLLEELIVASASVQRADDAIAGAPFTVLSCVGETDIPARRKGGQFGTNLKKVVLSSHYVQMLKSCPTVSLSSEIIGQVMQLRNQVSRTSAKWLLAGQEERQLGINDLLHYVGCKGSKVMMSKYRRQLMDDAAQLSGLGIVIESGQVVFSGNHGVAFDCPFDMAAYSNEHLEDTYNNQNLTEIYFVDSGTTSVDGGRSQVEQINLQTNNNSAEQAYCGAIVNQTSVDYTELLVQHVNQISEVEVRTRTDHAVEAKSVKSKEKKSKKVAEQAEQFSLW